MTRALRLPAGFLLALAAVPLLQRPLLRWTAGGIMETIPPRSDAGLHQGLLRLDGALAVAREKGNAVLVLGPSAMGYALSGPMLEVEGVRRGAAVLRAPVDGITQFELLGDAGRLARARPRAVVLMLHATMLSAPVDFSEETRLGFFFGAPAARFALRRRFGVGDLFRARRAGLARAIDFLLPLHRHRRPFRLWWLDAWPAPPANFTPLGWRPRVRYRVEADQALALADWLARLRRAGVPVALVDAPVPAGYEAELRPAGYRAALDDAAARFSVPLWRCPLAFGDDEFFDDRHLKPRGQKRFTLWFLGQLDGFLASLPSGR